MKEISVRFRRLTGWLNSLLEKHHGVLFLLAMLVMGLVARWFFVPFASGDMIANLVPWLHTIRDNGGLASLGSMPGDYTPPYMILMALVSYLPLADLVAVKLINVAGDLLLACAVHALAMTLTKNAWRARLCCVMVWLLPTVILNSSAWGQCDAIFTAFLVLFLNSYMKGRYFAAMVFFGVAVAFKQQAVFLAPLVVVLVVSGKIWLRHALVSLAAYAALFLPSILMGSGVDILWRMYFSQQQQHADLVYLGIANLYVTLAEPAVNRQFMGGYMLFGFAVIGVFCYWLWLHRAQLSPRAVLCAAVFMAILIPYVLPKMHERYYFIADILTLVFAMCFPRRWYVAVLMQLVSLFTYVPFLYGNEPPFTLQQLGLVPIVLLAAVGFTLWLLFRPQAALD